MTGDSALTSMGFSGDAWLMRSGGAEDGVYYWYYPHLKGFDLNNGTQIDAANIASANWPSKVTVNVVWKESPSYSYNGTEQGPTVEKVTVSNGSKVVSATDYIVEYHKQTGSDNPTWSTDPVQPVDEGTYKAVIKFANNDTLEKEFRIKPPRVTCTVTFKVVNGSWDDGEGEEAKKDRIVELSRDADEDRLLILQQEQIPAVGSKPDAGYKAGSWDTTPTADTLISKDTVYTYTYAKEDTAPDPYNTIPATEENAIAVRALIKDGVASVADISISEINQAASGNAAIIDLSKVTVDGKTAEIKEIELTKSTINNFVSSDATGLEVRLSTGSAVVDKASLEAIASEAAGGTVSLYIATSTDAEKTMNDAQKAVIEGMEGASANVVKL
jgi:hypothetical protein